MDLAGKTVLLTWATGGIGRELVYALARREARLIITGRRQDALDEILKSLPDSHRAFNVDLNESVERQQLVDALSASDTTIDVLINNAGMSEFALLGNTDSCNIEDLIRVNLISPILLTKGLLPRFNASGAQITNIGSTFGAVGYPGYTAYCASKFGLRGFTEALSRELSDTAVRVQYVAPRATATSINTHAVYKMNKAMGNHMDDPAWVAEQICIAVESEKPCRNLGWPEKAIIPMNSVFKSLFDRLIKKQLPTIKRFAKEQ